MIFVRATNNSVHKHTCQIKRKQDENEIQREKHIIAFDAFCRGKDDDSRAAINNNMNYVEKYVK